MHEVQSERVAASRSGRWRLLAAAIALVLVTALTTRAEAGNVTLHSDSWGIDLGAGAFEGNGAEFDRLQFTGTDDSDVATASISGAYARAASSVSVSSSQIGNDFSFNYALSLNVSASVDDTLVSGSNASARADLFYMYSSFDITGGPFRYTGPGNVYDVFSSQTYTAGDVLGPGSYTVDFFGSVGLTRPSIAVSVGVGQTDSASLTQNYSYSLTAVPLPPAGWLGLGLLGGLGLIRRLRRRRE